MTTAELQTIAAQDAQLYGIDPAAFLAQIQQESGFNPDGPPSSAGCQGIAQICDAVPFDPLDPIASLNYAAKRMAAALQKYGGNYALALASYNCGNGCADNIAAGTQSVPSETVNYIKSIQALIPSFAGAGSNTYAGGTTSIPAGGVTSLPNGTPATSAQAFAPAALPSGVTTFIVVICALLLLIGLLGMVKGGGDAPQAPTMAPA